MQRYVRHRIFFFFYRSLDAIVDGDDAVAGIWLTDRNIALDAEPLARFRRFPGLMNVIQHLAASRSRPDACPLHLLAAGRGATPCLHTPECRDLHYLLSTPFFAAKGYMARGGQIIDAGGTGVTRTISCGLAAHRQGGSRSPPSCGRRTAMRAGPRSMAASSATRPCERGRKHKLIRHYAVSDADRGPTQGQRLQEPDSPTRSAQPPAVFGAKASEPRQEPDTRSYRACIRSAAERAGRSDRAHDWHGAGARQNRLAEPGLQHSPLGDAGTARRGMKVKSLCSFNRSSGRDGAVKTAIKLKTAPDIVPPHAAKSTIVRGADPLDQQTWHMRLEKRVGRRFANRQSSASQKFCGRPAPRKGCVGSELGSPMAGARAGCMHLPAAPFLS